MWWLTVAPGAVNSLLFALSTRDPEAHANRTVACSTGQEQRADSGIGPAFDRTE